MPQFSTRILFLLTLVVALDVAACIAWHWFYSPSFLIAATVLISIPMLTHTRARIHSVATISFLLCMVNCALIGAIQSMYLLVFDRDRALASFGLGNPISAGIISGLIGLPYAILSFLCLCIIGIIIRHVGEKPTQNLDSRQGREHDV
jgi:hypothetical protein